MSFSTWFRKKTAAGKRRRPLGRRPFAERFAASLLVKPLESRLVLSASPFSSTVSLDLAGNLVIADAATNGHDDALTIQATANSLIVSDANRTLDVAAIPGAVVSGDNKSVEIPLSSIMGKIVANLGAGDDSLTIDLSLAGLGKAIEVNGGVDNDAVTLFGNNSLAGLSIDGQAGNDQVSLNGDLSLDPNSDLLVTAEAIAVAPWANLSTSGTGSIAFTADTIAIDPSATITTGPLGSFTQQAQPPAPPIENGTIVLTWGADASQGSFSSNLLLTESGEYSDSILISESGDILTITLLDGGSFDFVQSTQSDQLNNGLAYFGNNVATIDLRAMNGYSSTGFSVDNFIVDSTTAEIDGIVTDRIDIELNTLRIGNLQVRTGTAALAGDVPGGDFVIGTPLGFGPIVRVEATEIELGANINLAASNGLGIADFVGHVTLTAGGMNPSVIISGFSAFITGDVAGNGRDLLLDLEISAIFAGAVSNVDDLVMIEGDAIFQSTVLATGSITQQSGGVQNTAFFAADVTAADDLILTESSRFDAPSPIAVTIGGRVELGTDAADFLDIAATRVTFDTSASSPHADRSITFNATTKLAFEGQLAATSTAGDITVNGTIDSFDPLVTTSDDLNLFTANGEILITALGDIGSQNALGGVTLNGDAVIQNANITVLGSGAVQVTADAGDITMADLTTTTSELGAITYSASGNVLLSLLQSTSGGNLLVTATAGSISDHTALENANLITSATATLIAGGNIGAAAAADLDTTIGTLVARSDSGDIFLQETADLILGSGNVVATLGYVNLDVVSGNLTQDGDLLAGMNTLVTVDAGSISMTDQTVTRSTLSITYRALHNIDLSVLESTASASIVVTSTAGAITDNLVSEGANVITADGTAIFTAASGIGSPANDLDTTIATLVATTTSGNIFIQETNALVIGGAGVRILTGDGDLNLRVTTGNLTQSAVVSAVGDGNILVAADGGNIHMDDGQNAINDAGQIRYEASGGIDLSLLDSNTGDLFVQAGAAITDTTSASDPTVNLDTLGAATLIAGTGIGGSGSADIDTTITTLVASSATGDIFLQESAELILGAGNVVATTGSVNLNVVSGNLTQNGDIVAGANTLVTVDAGSITMTSATETRSVGAITYSALNNVALSLLQSTGSGPLTVTASAGAISDNLAGEAANLIGLSSAVTLTAATGIGSVGEDLDTTIGSLTASTATGDIYLQETNGLSVTSIVASTGNLRLNVVAGDLLQPGSIVVGGAFALVTASAGSIVMNSAGQTTSAGTIAYQAANNIQLTVLQTTTAGEIALQALGGSITDNTPGEGLNLITAGTLTFFAAAGFGTLGSNGDIDTQVAILVGDATQGDIVVGELNDIELQFIRAFAGEVEINSGGIIQIKNGTFLESVTGRVSNAPGLLRIGEDNPDDVILPGDPTQEVRGTIGGIVGMGDDNQEFGRNLTITVVWDDGVVSTLSGINVGDKVEWFVDMNNNYTVNITPGGAVNGPIDVFIQREYSLSYLQTVVGTEVVATFQINNDANIRLNDVTTVDLNNTVPFPVATSLSEEGFGQPPIIQLEPPPPPPVELPPPVFVDNTAALPPTTNLYVSLAVAEDEGQEQLAVLYLVRVLPDGSEGPRVLLPLSELQDLSRLLERLRKVQMPSGLYRIYHQEPGLPSRKVLEFRKTGDTIGDPVREPGRGANPVEQPAVPQQPAAPPPENDAGAAAEQMLDKEVPIAAARLEQVHLALREATADSFTPARRLQRRWQQ